MQCTTGRSHSAREAQWQCVLNLKQLSSTEVGSNNSLDLNTDLAGFTHDIKLCLF